MRQSRVVLPLFLAFATTFGCAQASPDSAGVPVSMVVTVQAHHGSDSPAIASENVIVYQNRTRAKVTDWVPLQGDRAGLELFILLDDSHGTSYGTQLEDLRRFIMGQPATAKIGVAYMQMSGPKIVQSLTSDHSLAANALQLSLANLANGSNPFDSLGDLIDKWPAGSDRREVLMISKGMDDVYGNNPGAENDPYVDTAIEKAQRAGVIVFTIVASNHPAAVSRADMSDIHSERNFSGKNYLARIAEETGGELYDYRSSAPTSFAPYLEDSTRRLNRQYLVSFLVQPGKKAGMQSVKVRTEVPHAQLVAAEKVYVPAR
ncbi:MAG: hypothetical protein ABSG34_01975 [Candidatus Sulfotelmatobacter sp.]|jgi:hypothetical protein